VGAGYLSSENDQNMQGGGEQEMIGIFENKNNYALRESINSTSTLGGRQEGHNQQDEVLADRTNMVINPPRQRQKSGGSHQSLVAKVTGIKNPSLK
jgi:hypothetical protein